MKFGDIDVLFIDNKEFNIHDKIPEGSEFIDWFMCDESIAETVSILNKKGYITDSNSCGGHMPIIRGPIILNYDVVRRGPYIAFKDNITIPSYPAGFYQIPLRVGEKFSNCLVSSISEMFLDNNQTFLPYEKINIEKEKKLPKIDNSGYMHLTNDLDASSFLEYYEQCLLLTRKSLQEWAKSLPLHIINGQIKNDKSTTDSMDSLER